MGYSIEDIGDAGIKSYCEMYGIPLIGWTVKDEASQQYAESICGPEITKAYFIIGVYSSR